MPCGYQQPKRKDKGGGTRRRNCGNDEDVGEAASRSRCKRRQVGMQRKCEERCRASQQLQNFAMLSFDAASTEAPTAENTAVVMTATCLESVRRHVPIAELQIFAVLSYDAGILMPGKRKKALSGKRRTRSCNSTSACNIRDFQAAICLRSNTQTC